MLVETNNAVENWAKAFASATKRRSVSNETRRPLEIVGIGKFLAIVAQLVMLSLLIRRFHLESPAFFQLTVLSFTGFMIHYFLPLTYGLGTAKKKSVE